MDDERVLDDGKPRGRVLQGTGFNVRLFLWADLFPGFGAWAVRLTRVSLFVCSSFDGQFNASCRGALSEAVLMRVLPYSASINW